MKLERTVASFLASQLQSYGVTHVFELVGGMVTVLLDSLHQEPGIHVVSMHHEQGAGFAAEGFARVTGQPAIAIATSGPGATNLLTAIGSCYFDSVPVVFITGQVNRAELSLGTPMRQGGFQETDIVTMASPITKWAKLVEDPASFPEDLDMAFQIAIEGRRGPVLLDIPMDVQRSVLPMKAFKPTNSACDPGSTRSTNSERETFLERLSGALNHAQRPVVLVGGGVRSACAVDQLRSAVEKWGVPVVTSLLGIDVISHDSPLHVGFIGSYGNRWANWAVAKSDLVLVLGSRLDVRQTGSDIAGFNRGRRIFHVDIDPAELNTRVPHCDTLNDDLKQWLPLATDFLSPRPEITAKWLNEIADRRELWPDTRENIPGAGPNPNQLMHLLSESLPDTTVFVTDVGQHQMWAAQSLRIRASSRFLTSGGMGSMGFGLPAAIGASLAHSGNPVCLIAGDGGFQCNIQELQTLVRLNLPIMIVVLDNGSHGMVRQFQESYLSARYFSTKWGYSAPNFQRLGEAYGISSWTISNEEEAGIAIQSALALGAPALIHVKLDDRLNAYPKMAFGQPFGSMEPGILPLEMEGT